MLISLSCLFGAIAIDRYQVKMRNSGFSGSSSFNTIWSFVVIVFGIGLYFGLTSIGSLGNIDTTGKASSGTQTASLIFCAVLVIAGLVFVTRKK